MSIATAGRMRLELYTEQLTLAGAVREGDIVDKLVPCISLNAKLIAIDAVGRLQHALVRLIDRRAC